MQKPLLLGLGEVLWDTFADGTRRAGGAPANVVFRAAHSGAEGCLISAVGEDPAGRELLAALRQNGIAYEAPCVPYPTGRTEVVLHEGLPSYQIVENVAWDHIPLTARAQALAQRADAVCFGSLAFRAEESRRTLTALLQQVPETALKVLDVNLRAPYYSAERLDFLLRHANALKINDEELQVLSPLFGWSGTPQQRCEAAVWQYGLRFLILTAGAQYSEVFVPGACSRLDTPSVTVADTVGAGDAFTGAFVCALLAGKPWREAHREAVQTAARVCTQEGAWVS